LKVIKAGLLIYEDGNLCFDGWIFDGEGENPSDGEAVSACLEYIAEEQGSFPNHLRHARLINADRLMLDCIQRAKEKQ
jgi:hypothetical protein